MMNPATEIKGRIFNIQKYSIYDGDGIRTLIFLKGCNIRCPWCANPEGLSSQFQVMFSHDKCVGCGKCVDVCPAGIHYMTTNEQGEKSIELIVASIALVAVNVRKCAFLMR